MHKWRGCVKLQKFTDVLRVFKNIVDFDIQNTGWKMLIEFAFAHDHRWDKGPAEIELLEWMLQFYDSDISENLSSRHCKKLLLMLLNWEEAFDCFFKKGPTRDPDSVGPPRDFTLLQMAIATGCKYGALLKHRPQLNEVRYEHDYSRRPETPTSVAMYCAREFQKWQISLKYMHVNIEDFIDRELKQSPLADSRWTKDALRQLFQYKIEPAVSH